MNENDFRIPPTNNVSKEVIEEIDKRWRVKEFEIPFKDLWEKNFVDKLNDDKIIQTKLMKFSFDFSVCLRISDDFNQTTESWGRRFDEQMKNVVPSMIIFLFHGWSSDKMGMVKQVLALVSQNYQCCNDESRGVKVPRPLDEAWFVCINAPFQENINSPEIRFWWPITSESIIHTLVDEDFRHEIFAREEEGQNFSINYCKTIIEYIKNRVNLIRPRNEQPRTKYVFLGFSQGGGMALSSYAKYIEVYKSPPDALIICSGLLSNSDYVENVLFSSKTIDYMKKTSVLHCHGTKDVLVVPLDSHGEDYYRFLQKFGFQKIRSERPAVAHEIEDRVRRQILIELSRLLLC